MEININSKVQIMKPVLLKAGIPLAISIAGFILARISTRKSPILTNSAAENQENSHENHTNEGSSSDLELEEEILGLRIRVHEIQEMELELERRFLRYNDMRNQELVLMEEISKVEFLEREILMLEEERQRFENMVFDYFKVIEILEISRSENGLLQRKLLRESRENSCLIKEKCLEIEAKEEEISRNYEELEKRDNVVIRKMEEEIEEMKMDLNAKEMEKNELLNKIEIANKVSSSKKEAEEATIAEYGKVISKLEQVEKERANDMKELIYLRWCNEGLRHELLGRNQEDQDKKEAEKDQMELHFGEIGHFGNGDSYLGFPTTNAPHSHSKRRKFIQKLKKWMEGSDRTRHKHDEVDLHIPQESHTLVSNNP